MAEGQASPPCKEQGHKLGQGGRGQGRHRLEGCQLRQQQGGPRRELAENKVFL